MNAPKLRPELTPLPETMLDLPVDARGYPVPWFVPWVNGAPEFRAGDQRKLLDAIRFSKCWVCGKPLGRHKSFVIGPMCGINRTTSEPGCHLECARWSAINCPFLNLTEKKRREDEALKAMTCPAAGIMNRRQPGVTLVWTTRVFSVFSDGRRGLLFHLGDPSRTEFFARGRAATRQEIIESVESGLPTLRELAAQNGPEAIAALESQKAAFEQLYPAETEADLENRLSTSEVEQQRDIDHPL